MKKTIIVNNNQLTGNAFGISRYYNSLEPFLIEEFQLQPLFNATSMSAILRKTREQFVSLSLNNSIVWSPSQSGPLFVRKHIVTIHDIIPMHPEADPPYLYRKYFSGFLRMLVKNAVHVVCISAAVADQVQVSFGVRSHKLSVIRNGFDFMIERHAVDVELPDFLSEDNYLLFVGTLGRHKNLERLVNAFLLFKQLTNSQKHLVIAGNFPKSMSLGTVKMDFESLFSKGIHCIVNPDDNLLSSLYRNCGALIMPSLVEGFGLPIVEALSFNKPVICSDISVFRELFSGMIRVYFNPYEIESMAKAIDTALESGSVLTKNEFNAYIDAKKWTWHSAATEYQRLFMKFA